MAVAGEAGELVAEFQWLTAEESKRSNMSQEKLKDVELEMLDPTGVVVQKWILQSCQLNDVDFGGLDYSSSDLADITCTLRFDRAINVF